MKTTDLATKWERLVRVRARFRQGLPWLKFAKSAENDYDLPATTKSFQYNAEVLSCLLQTSRLAAVKLGPLTKQAGCEISFTAYSCIESCM